MLALNISQHEPTELQVLSGLMELNKSDVTSMKKLLTFDEAPDISEMKNRAEQLVKICANNYNLKVVMLAPAPFFTSILENTFKENGYKVVYSFSQRKSVEKKMPDGTVKKVNVFEFQDFIEV